MKSPRVILSAILGVCAMLLSACRLDVDATVVMQPDGTGTVTVEAVADAELMAEVPDLANDLRLDDAVAQGWVVEGPTVLTDGGAEISLSHPFASPVELANLLNSIGPPLQDVRIARTPGEEQTVNAIDASLGLASGYESFADSDLIAAVGGVPFGERITASGLPPQDAFSFRLHVDFPGQLVRAVAGTDENGVITWDAQTDGQIEQIRLETAQQTGGAAAWVGPVATVAFYAFLVWSILSVAFIAFVAIARRKKSQRRNQALRNLG